MYEGVVERLAGFGYAVALATDAWLINFCISKATDEIRNECNVAEIPEGLRHVAVDMACGEFLKAKQAGGGAHGALCAKDGSPVPAGSVKQIQEGDTTIVFSDSGPDGDKAGREAFEGMVAWLLAHGRSQLVAYRKMRW